MWNNSKTKGIVSGLFGGSATKTDEENETEIYKEANDKIQALKEKNLAKSQADTICQDINLKDTSEMKITSMSEVESMEKESDETLSDITSGPNK